MRPMARPAVTPSTQPSSTCQRWSLPHRRMNGIAAISPKMKPPENWIPPCQMAITSTGLWIWSVWVRAQVSREPMIAASTTHVPIR